MLDYQIQLSKKLKTIIALNMSDTKDLVHKHNNYLLLYIISYSTMYYICGSL